MIKEILLASALTLSNNNLFYDLDGNITKFGASISRIEFNDNLVSLVIDLNSGNYYVCDLYENQNETFMSEWEVSNIRNERVETFPLNISNFMNYLYSELGVLENAIFLDSYVEISYRAAFHGIDMSSTINNNATLSSFLAVPTENYNVLLQVSNSDTQNASEDNLNGNYAFIYTDIAGNSLNKDLFLVLNFYNYVVNPNLSVISFDYYFPYNDIYLEFALPHDIYIDSSTLNNRYTNFIYHDFHSIINENEDLERDNEILNGIIRDLRQENEELNSRHIFSNVFELVRGAFNGIIDFLQVEIMPNISIGMIIFIPVVIGVIFFILKALVL